MEALRNAVNQQKEKLKRTLKIIKKMAKLQEKKKKTFIIKLKLKVEFLDKGSWYELNGQRIYKKGLETLYVDESSLPITDYITNIPRLVEAYNITDSYTETTVISYTVEYMNTPALIRNKKPKIQQRMRRAFVLENNWLNYAYGIADYALHNHNDRCVYNQLVEFLLKPPSNKPNEFIYFTKDKRQPVSEESLFKFFCEKIKEKNLENAYPDFTIDFGVSPELVGFLCESLKRNMYVYDDDDKMFYSITTSDSKNYCPIIYYKMNGHMFIITDKNVIRSVAESNKTTTRIITTTIEEKKEENTINLPITQLEYYDVAKSNEMTEGIYLVNKSNLDDEVNEFVKLFNTKPYIRANNTKIIELKFMVGIKNENKKYVSICVDITNGKRYEYEQLKNVATHNNIPYVNEDIGSLVLNIIKEDKDIENSVFNNTVLNNIVKKDAWKSHAFIERVKYEIDIDNIEKDKLKTYKNDICKCRRNILLHSKYEFPVYSIMDTSRTFNGKIVCGMYYIDTQNIYPFRGCGWYSQPIVEYGIKHKLIKLSDIKMEFLPSYVLPANHFHKNINKLLLAFDVEPSIGKLSINSLIGLMGVLKRQHTTIKITTEIEEASEWYCENKENVFIQNIDLGNDIKLYKGFFTENIELEGMKYPIYKQIVEMEAIELHTLETIIKKDGGIILDRNTDAIRYVRKNPINIKNRYWDNERTVLKYQKEEPKPLRCESLPKKCRKNELDLNVFNLNWNMLEYTDAKSIVEMKQSIHINGRAGTGKTFIVNKIMEELKKQKINYLAYSPTNKGALLINGKTIHSLYYKFKANKKSLFGMLKRDNIEYIFIDEVSMMIKDFYQLFIMIKRGFKHIKYIIAGDFAQLPPVKDDWEGDYENSPAMYNLCDGNRINLTECKRADRELYDLCCDVNSIDIQKFLPYENTYLNLAYSHNTRIRVNRECMERFIEKFKCNYISIAKDDDNDKTQNVKLAIGMPIISHVNDKKKDILNSQSFIINKITDTQIHFNDGGQFYTIKINEFSKMFYLGFCRTIHSSQGETFNEKYTIYDWNFKYFCDKAKYVAMSRGTSVINIQISL